MKAASIYAKNSPHVFNPFSLFPFPLFPLFPFSPFPSFSPFPFFYQESLYWNKVFALFFVRLSYIQKHFTVFQHIVSIFLLAHYRKILQPFFLHLSVRFPFIFSMLLTSLRMRRRRKWEKAGKSGKSRKS